MSLPLSHARQTRMSAPPQTRMSAPPKTGGTQHYRKWGVYSSVRGVPGVVETAGRR